MLAPRDLFYAFLPIHTKDGRSVNTLCSACAELRRTTGTCQHWSERRSLKGTWPIAEIAYSISIGYKLLHVYEILNFPKTAKILEPFFSHILAYKLRYSGFPPGTTDRQQYCDAMNSDISPGIKLTPENVVRDEARRQFYKDLTVTSIGKMSQNLSKHRSIVVSTESQLIQLLTDPDCTVDSINVLDENTAQVVTIPHLATIAVNRRGNTLLYIHVLSFSRIFMHKNVMLLHKKGMRVLYTDIDNLVYERKKGAKTPLKLGQRHGQFKTEFEGEDIVNYAALGARTCSFVLRNRATGELRTKMKANSFCLDASVCSSRLNHAIFDDLLRKAIDKKFASVSILQKRRHSLAMDKAMVVLKEHKFGNSITDKRVVCLDTMMTMPYGYKR
jgi:hypothetical protein